jgi:hypothetical protein
MAVGLRQCTQETEPEGVSKRHEKRLAIHEVGYIDSHTNRSAELAWDLIAGNFSII